MIELIRCLAPNYYRPPTTHGSAKLGDFHDAKRGGLLAEFGPVLGRAEYLASGPNRRLLLRLRNFTHLACFAATGRGKSVGITIPNAYFWPKSLVLLDKNGEVFEATSEYRKQAYGQKQIRLDPHFTRGDGGQFYNPLDFIDDQSSTFFDDCWALAKLLVFRKGTEHEPHWNDSAELVITAFIAFVCACEKNPAERNLLTVQRLASSPKAFAKAVSVMQQITSHHGVIARLGGLLAWFVDKELSSVATTTNRHLAFLSSPPVARMLSRSSFDPKELLTQLGATIYICFAADKMDVMPPLNRLLVGSLLHAAARALPAERNEVLFLLDEIGHAGRIDALAEGVTLLRGAGIRLWLIFQSLHQVRDVYGDKAGTLLDNIDTQLYFGINSVETAEALAKRIGQGTITDFSVNKTYSFTQPQNVPFSEKQPGSTSTSTSVTRTQIARSVLFADEITRLPEDVGLLFHRNLPVLPVKLLRYFAEPEFAHCLPKAVRAAQSSIRQAGSGLPLFQLFGQGVMAAVCLLLFSLAGFAFLGGGGTSSGVPSRSSDFYALPVFESAVERDAERERLFLEITKVKTLERRLERRPNRSLFDSQLDKVRMRRASLEAALDALEAAPPPNIFPSSIRPQAETVPSAGLNPIDFTT
jgi:type IV secretion system protein VirD4